MSFAPSRLSIARKRRMLTKKELAERCNITPHTISRCEKGDTVPSDETVQIIARVLNYPFEFFFLDDIEEPTGASFRSLTSMTASIRDAALSAGSLGFILADWLQQNFNIPSPQLPDLSLYTPSVAARTLREEWSLGERPISNMIQLLESKGVLGFSLFEETAKMNAFSIWRNQRPFVFLNNYKSAESSRFDAAHELAHLVLHQDGASTGRQAEDEANQFASSFLMPSSDVHAQIPSVMYLDQIVRHKKRWRVSAAALAYRVHKLEIISDWRYRDFCIEMSKRGYNTKEPFPIERESSALWTKVLQSLWQDGRTIFHVAQSLNLPDKEVAGLILGLTSPAPPTDKKGIGLRLVNQPPHPHKTRTP